MPDVVLYPNQEQHSFLGPAQCHGGVVIFRLAVFAVLRKQNLKAVPFPRPIIGVAINLNTLDPGHLEGSAGISHMCRNIGQTSGGKQAENNTDRGNSPVAPCTTYAQDRELFYKVSDQRERTISNRAVARNWLAALPPCEIMSYHYDSR